MLLLPQEMTVSRTLICLKHIIKVRDLGPEIWKRWGKEGRTGYLRFFRFRQSGRCQNHWYQLIKLILGIFFCSVRQILVAMERCKISSHVTLWPQDLNFHLLKGVWMCLCLSCNEMGKTSTKTLVPLLCDVSCLFLFYLLSYNYVFTF